MNPQHQRLRVLSLSTLFPCPARPRFGGFVANQMRAVAENETIDLVMVNPIGVPPWPLSRLGRYRRLATCPPTSQIGSLTVHHLRFASIPGLAEGNPARIARALLPLARRWHGEQPFDLVDAQFAFPDGPAAAAIAAALGLPLTIKARGADILHWGQRPRARAQIQAAGNAARLQLAVSAALTRDMAALGLPEATMRLHHTGLDHACFRLRDRAEARAALAPRLGLTLPATAPLLASPGALIARKGQALAIAAIAHLPEAHLALAGAGPEAGALAAQARRLGLETRVHFLGEIDHDRLALLLAAADVVVLPSASEGLANAWVEALACGTPLVIPDVGGAREVITAPSAGRIAAREPEAIAAAIADLLAAPPAPAEVAAHAARFTWEANAHTLAALWREAAGEKGAG